MTPDDDDDALTWAGGGSDPSYVENLEPVRPLRVRKAPVAEPVEAPTQEQELPPVTSAAVLLSLGVLAGVYLLYTIGWIVSLQRFVYFATDPLDGVAFTAEQVLAIVAAPLWFAASVWFTRQRRPQVRLVWLVVGAVALIPWPFVLGS